MKFTADLPNLTGLKAHEKFHLNDGMMAATVTERPSLFENRLEDFCAITEIGCGSQFERKKRVIIS